jgi:hypothetical protein
MSTLDVTMFQEVFSVSVTLVTVVMVEHVSVSYNFLFFISKDQIRLLFS